MRRKKSSGTIWFDIPFTVVIFILLILSSVEFRAISLFTPLFFVLVGSAFLYCKSYREVSYVAKVLFWISDNVPITIVKFKSIHIFIGFFMIGIGIASALFPSNRDVQRDQLLWRELRGSLSFWLSVILILLFNLMVGFYNYSKKRRFTGKSNGKSN
jgi:hypothetical protein